MQVGDVLFKKNSSVTTALPETTVLMAAKMMTTITIGLLLICNQPSWLVGWLSERGIVRTIVRLTP